MVKLIERKLGKEILEYTANTSNPLDKLNKLQELKTIEEKDKLDSSFIAKVIEVIDNNPQQLLLLLANDSVSNIEIEFPLEDKSDLYLKTVISPDLNAKLDVSVTNIKSDQTIDLVLIDTYNEDDENHTISSYLYGKKDQDDFTEKVITNLEDL